MPPNDSRMKAQSFSGNEQLLPCCTAIRYNFINVYSSFNLLHKLFANWKLNQRKLSRAFRNWKMSLKIPGARVMVCESGKWKIVPVSSGRWKSICLLIKSQFQVELVESETNTRQTVKTFRLELNLKRSLSYLRSENVNEERFGIRVLNWFSI